MSELYFTTDGKNYQEFQGLQEVEIQETEVNPIDEIIKAKEIIMSQQIHLKSDMVDKSDMKEIATKDIMNSGTFDLKLGFDARRLIPRGQRNREILRRDGYLSPKNADFMRGFDE